MTARGTIDDGLQWLSAVIERLHDEPALITKEFTAAERYATLLVLDAIHQHIRSELRRGSQNRLDAKQSRQSRVPHYVAERGVLSGSKREALGRFATKGSPGLA